VNVYPPLKHHGTNNGILIKPNDYSTTLLPVITQNVNYFDRTLSVVTYSGQYFVLTQYLEKSGRHLVWTIFTLIAIYFFLSYRNLN
jgi:hypothetical protein